MKLRDSSKDSRSGHPSRLAVDAWLASVESTFGIGWHTSTLRRLAPAISELIQEPSHLNSCVVEFGYQLGSANLDLDLTIKCLEILTTVVDGPLADTLNTRNVAVLVAEGWNSGMVGRLQPSLDLLTPMSVFVHLLQQRYLENKLRAERRDIQGISKRAVVVVVDLRDVATTEIEIQRIRATTIRTIREVCSAGQPISEGANGNLVVMVERDSELHPLVGKLRRLILSDTSVHANRIHVWIEPLSDTDIHLESHLESLVGPIEAPPSPIRRTG